MASSGALTALLLFVLLAGLLAARRLAGAMTQPLAGPIVVPLAAGVAAASVLLRLWLLPLRLDNLRLGRIDWQTMAEWSLVIAPSLAMAVLLASIVTPGTSLPAGLAAWIFTAAIEGLFWRHLAVVLPLRPTETIERLSQRRPPLQEAAPENSAEEAYPENLLQQLVRTRHLPGGESIHAALRADFRPGEQVQILHVAFCPPLATVPRLEAFTSGEMQAEVRVTHAYTFGARVELHLAAPAREPVNVMVEVTGHS